MQAGLIKLAFAAAGVAIPVLSLAQSVESDASTIFGARSLALSPDGKRIAFNFQGDIWVASTTGGQAVPLTSNVEYDDNPVWSPDGKSIAFSSNRTGNDDIFIVSASGGTPRRLTWFSGGDVPSDWSPDGKSILVRSTRDDRNNGIFTIDVATGQFRGWVWDAMSIGSPKFSPDGKQILYTRFGFPWVRPRYNGSAAAQLWVYNLETQKRAKLRDTQLQHLWPNWTDNGIHTVTVTAVTPSSSPLNKPIPRVVYTPENTPNLYSVALNGRVTPLTRYAGDSVRFLAVAKKAPVVAYERNGRIFISQDGKSSPLNLTAAIDDKLPLEQREIVTSGATDFSLSPNGETFLFAARNELWSVPVKKGTGPNKDDATRLTTWEGTDEQPLWTLDGKAYFFVSDREGVERLYRTEVGSDKVTGITNEDADVSELKLTPDGKSVSFWLKGRNGGLYTVPVEGGTPKRVFARPGNESFDYDWSPDGRYIAYSEVLTGSGYYYWESGSNIFVVEAATGKTTNVTQLNVGHFVPRWSADGKFIYFGSSRQGGGIFVIPLQPEAARADELELKFEKPKGPVKVEIDFNNIELRVRRITSTPLQGNMVVDPENGSVYFNTGGGISRMDYNGDNVRPIVPGGGVGNFELSRNGRQLAFVREGKLNLVEIRNPQNPITTVEFRADWVRDLRRERRAAFVQFWREFNRGFYDPNFHGRDWVALREKYEPYLASVAHRQDFSTVLNMMAGELEASHAEVGPAPGGNPSEQSAHLGFTIDYTWGGDGIRIKDVPERTPGSFKNSQLLPGEVVLQINGKPVRANEALYRDVLNQQVGRELTLQVRNRSGEVRTVKYRALSSGEFSSIVFQNLLNQRRRYVEEKSGGRLTYVHIAGMSGPELDRFQQQVWQYTQGKKGLIIDVRNNGGGNTADRIIDILERRPNAFYQIRDEAPIGGPGQVADFPMVVLHAETSFSNAEMFPNSVQTRGLAKLVGMPTPGYVIYTYGLTLVDGTSARMPSTGVFRLNGRPLENEGVVPDYQLTNDPDAFLEGIDAQLDKAIEVLLRQAK